ncbi:unnamed protein product [Adineta ricciae]|uniref:NAD(P)(+)--arginine ADP-ribosyltransferase n=1 Tax=Adineta ricciae TaxID=249248 RepID=A0A816ALI3_ADIRI|nr:unnamed protein product [Adineta ricciae]CAF1599101.1 unnamed protein product [Adineta ricciae]
MEEAVVPGRFTDVADEPEQTLVPLKGYEECDIVSIEEALEPVRDLLYNLDAMIYTARRNSRKPRDNLTEDESAAIHLYTMQWPKQHSSLYKLLNERLRSVDREGLKPWFLYLRLPLNALYKLPSQKKIVWRGVRGNLYDQYKEDQIWWGVSSCIETMQVMVKFIGIEGIRTIFQIECFSGKMIRDHSYYKTENEIILSPGCFFRVVERCKIGKDLYMIQLREEESPYETVPPLPDLFKKVNESTTVSAPYILDGPGMVPWSNLKSIIHKSLRSRKQAIETIAGGNRRGFDLDHLNSPHGIFIDTYDTIYVADYENNRIVAWESRRKTKRILVGRNQEISRPTEVVVDEQNGSLIIADLGNKRVIRWSNGSQEILVENIECFGLAMDTDGFIYVSDWKRNEVRRLKKGDIEERVVAGGNGKGDNKNQLNCPASLFVTHNQSVYVSDSNNNRVIKWRKGAREGTIVAGGNGVGKSLNQLDSPRGLFVDHHHRIYIADNWNGRVMCWHEGDREGVVIAGNTNDTKAANYLSSPRGLAFDSEGNLYIADLGTHRIQKYRNH